MTTPDFERDPINVTGGVPLLRTILHALEEHARALGRDPTGLLRPLYDPIRRALGWPNIPDPLNRTALSAPATNRESEGVKAPKGHVIDDEGSVRKVLGSLPLTADGCVIGHGGVIHCNVRSRGVHGYGIFQSSMTECDDFSAEPFDGRNWFSTTEAAEAARRNGAADGR